MIAFARAIARIIALGRPPAAWAMLSAATLVISALVGVVPPIVTGRIIDALQRSDARATAAQLAIYAGMTLLGAALGVVNARAMTTLRETTAQRLRGTTMRKLLSVSMSSLERLTFGEVTNRLSEDLDALCARVESSLFPIVTSLTTLTATLIATFAIDRRFAAISCIAAALAVIPGQFAIGPARRRYRADTLNHDERTAIVGESATLGGVMLLRHPGAARRQIERYEALTAATHAIRRGIAMIGAFSSFATTTAGLLGPIAVLSLGAFLLLHHAVTAGTIVTFLLFQSRLYAPFMQLSGLPVQISACGVYAQRILQIADLPDETAGDARFEDGEIVLRDLTIVKAGRAIVEAANVRIPAGAHVGIVGPSGAGKSTIGAALLRLHEPAHGSISIGRHALAHIALRSLRTAIVAVPQDPLVFDATLHENLTLLDPDADPRRVQRAIEICRLQSVLDALPEGLATRLGQRGGRLSGGERQRICVARALIARPRILVLDEALTGVDVEVEAHIIRSIREEFHDATILVVTHRLHSVVDLDSVIVIEDGRVSAHGSDREVRARSAWYGEASVAARMQFAAVPA